MRSLGWADYLKVEMTNNRKTLTASYWMFVSSTVGLVFQLILNP
jgi:hypothetical protein